jgi:hypothetical protein
MDSQKERQLERLVSTICDDGATAQDLQELESLLVNDPELQDRYWQLMSTHIALGVAVSCDTNKSLPGPIAGPGQSQSLAPPSWRSRLSNDPYLRFFSYAAALLLLGLGVGIWSLFGHELLVAITRGTNPQATNWVVDRIPTVTRVSWNGPTFSNDDDQWQLIDGDEAGRVSLQVKQAPSANGYLLCLPPDTNVELIATFDATGENCLSVVELVANDIQPVEKATFNNCGVGPKPWDANPTAQKRYGVLGRWFERNTTSSPRYFLLTGSHKLANPKPDQDWQLSEMAVLLERDGIIQIGWDDSGPAPGGKDEAYLQDDDFDDLAATLFLAPAGPAPSSKQAVEFVGENRDVVPRVVPQSNDAFRINLAPGEVAVFKAASWAAAPNALFLTHAATGSVYWSTSNTNAMNEVTRSRDLGAAALRNNSATSQEFLLFAAHHASKGVEADQQWQSSERKVFFEQPGYVILGFEDQGQDNDFDDVRVSVLRVSSANLPGAPQDVTSNHNIP